jgi:hypothetical protein
MATAPSLPRRENEMTDNKQHVGEPDRSRVSSSEDHELRHFAKKHHISVQEARELIAKHGNNLRALAAAAERLRRH